MTDYKKLSEALQTIKDECKKYAGCEDCPFSMVDLDDSDEWDNYICAIIAKQPEEWEIKPLSVIRLLESE